MSRTAKVNLPFGGQKRVFQLDVPRLDELQELTDLGPEAMIRHIQNGDYKTREISETLRLGLIGGGMEPNAAAIMVERYGSGPYVMDCKSLAYLILMAAISGAPESQKDGEPGESGGAGETPPTPES